ncbi:MAG: hypothetical protein LBP64_03235, partial [Tannerella sp.]|nr:hypothetical protein [Tannerella sp.]
DIPDKILYRYDEKKRITQILRCSDFSKDTIVQKFMGLSTSKQYDFCNYKDTLFHIYIYNQDGQLTDCLIEHSCKKIYLLEWYVGTIQR